MGFPEPEKYTIEDLAKLWDKSSDYIKDLIRQRKLIATSYLDGMPRVKGSIFPSMKSYVHRIEVQRFEKAYNLRSTPEQPVLRKSKYLSNELRLAVAAYTALYCGNNLPNVRLGHKDAIRKWLKLNGATVGLSKAAIERIATVVNPNQSGGAPAQE